MNWRGNASMLEYSKPAPCTYSRRLSAAQSAIGFAAEKSLQPASSSSNWFGQEDYAVHGAPNGGPERYSQSR